MPLPKLSPSLAPSAPGGGRPLAGGALVATSFALWVPLPALPFLPLSLGHKAVVGAALVGGAEIAFWLGLALAGPAVVQRLRDSWRRLRNLGTRAGFDSTQA